MAYTAKSYDHLKGGALKGLSDAQLDQHFTLYKGYVGKLNEIEERRGHIVPPVPLDDDEDAQIGRDVVLRGWLAWLGPIP